MAVKYQCKTISSHFLKLLTWRENWHYANGWRRLQQNGVRYVEGKFYLTLQRWK